jgi:hypothetical protein
MFFISFIWVWDSVSYTKGAGEQGAEENIWI